MVCDCASQVFLCWVLVSIPLICDLHGFVMFEFGVLATDAFVLLLREVEGI